MAAIDETLQLDGYLSNSGELPGKLPGGWFEAVGDLMDPTKSTTNFALFWKWFFKKVMQDNWVRYSILKVGEEKIEGERRRREELAEAKRKKDAEEARKRAWKSDWSIIVEELRASDMWGVFLEKPTQGSLFAAAKEEMRLTGSAESRFELKDAAGTSVVEDAAMDVEQGGGETAAALDPKPAEEVVIAESLPKKGGKKGESSQEKAPEAPVEVPREQRMAALRSSLPLDIELPSEGEHVKLLRKALDFLGLHEPESVAEEARAKAVEKREAFELELLGMDDEVAEAARAAAEEKAKEEKLRAGKGREEVEGDNERDDVWNAKAKLQWELFQSFLQVDSKVYDGEVIPEQFEALLELDWNMGILLGSSLAEDVARNRLAVKEGMEGGLNIGELEGRICNLVHHCERNFYLLHCDSKILL